MLVLEVLSRTTERADRYEKFIAYKNVPSLIDYVLIEQYFPRVEVFRRSTGWLREVFHHGEDVYLDSIKQTLTFDQIYRRVNFTEQTL